jgi:hypothetical protein
MTYLWSSTNCCQAAGGGLAETGDDRRLVFSGMAPEHGLEP